MEENEGKSKTMFRFVPTKTAFVGNQLYTGGKKGGKPRYYDSPNPVAPNRHFKPVGELSGDLVKGSEMMINVNKFIGANLDLDPRDPFAHWHRLFKEDEKKAVKMLDKCLKPKKEAQKKTVVKKDSNNGGGETTILDLNLDKEKNDTETENLDLNNKTEIKK